MPRFTLVLFVFLLVPVTAMAAPEYQYGEPIQHENLTLVPVYPPEGTAAYDEEYMTLAEASEEDLVEVTELEGNTSRAQVSAVHVSNKADRPLFLMAGEVILGGKQDRIISKNTIVPPKTNQMNVGVFCVEQGRWAGRKADFKASGKIGHTKLRTTAQFDSDQGAVWTEVAEQNKKSKVAPETGTYRATLDEKKLTKRVEAMVATVLPKLRRDQRALGVVVATDGKLHSMDVFANPKLFAGVQEQLVESYALAAVSSESKSKEPLSKKDIEGLNERIAKQRKTKRKRAAEKSGEASNDFYESAEGKQAVTKSKDGKEVHNFIDF